MEKRHGSAALQNVAVAQPQFIACVLECGGAPPLSTTYTDRADLLRRACYSFGEVEAIGGRALCQSVLCS